MTTENLYTKDCIRTYTGKYMNPFAPKPDDIDIRDIAHALSNICRWNGHCQTFYSVAQHCCVGVRMLINDGVMTGERKAFLLHDASEAYLLDLPKPVKMQMPMYVKAEKQLQELIYTVFKVGHFNPDIIAHYDKGMLEYEWDNVMLKTNEDVICWSPRYAEQRFIDLYTELFKIPVSNGTIQ